jgi:8-oxo-dGTP pyrophosphatase MutT (NUDIX family)
MTTVEEFSAGAVVFHEDDGREYLLLRYGAGHWGFPKGHIEGDESRTETTTREITEETSIPPEDQSIVEGFTDETHYEFQRGDTLVDKTVYFYLVESETQDVSLSHEHEDHAWLPYNPARERLTFDDPRRILDRADEFLEKARD